MGFDLEFLASFNETVVKKKKYDRLEEFLATPVRVTKGGRFARVLALGAPSPDETLGVRFSIPKGRRVEDFLPKNATLTGGDIPDVISQANGYLCAREGRLAITKFCEIDIDVGPKTGDIDFPSSIRVRGSVLNGFRVVSGGDVEILGLVEGAVVKAKGSVALKGGMAGGKKGVVTAGKDLYVSFAQQSRLEAKGTVIVDGSLVDCDVSAGDKVAVRGAGAIVGGVTRAKSGISVAKIGSEGGAPTEVELGYNPYRARIRAERKEKIERMKTEMERKEKDAQFVVRKFAGTLEYDPADPLSLVMNMSEMVRDNTVSAFDAEKKKYFKRLGSCLLPVIHYHEAIQSIEKHAGESDTDTGYADALLTVEKVAHPGVKLSILDRTMILDQEYERVNFVVRDDRITPVLV